MEAGAYARFAEDSEGVLGKGVGPFSMCAG